MNTKAIAALTQAKSLIDTPEKWGKKAFSFNGKICLVEAVMTSCKKEAKHSTLLTECINYLKEAWGDIPFAKVLTAYNDTHTHEEVMKLCDDAIKLASVPDAPVKQETKVTVIK